MPAASGTVVVVIERTQRDKGSVTLGAELDLEPRGRRWVAHEELLLPGQGAPERALQPSRQQDKERLEQRDLPAEATAHRSRDDPDLMWGGIKHLGDLVPDEERTLSRRPDRDATVRLGAHHGNVRLDKGVVHARDPIGRLDDGIRFGEAGPDIASLEGGHRADVARPLDGVRLRIRRRAVHRRIAFSAFGVRLEHLRRVVPHGMLGIADRG